MSTSCVLPGKPHQASVGLLICQNHLDEIGTWLIDVEHESDDLDARPSMAIRWDQGGHASLAFERAPVRISAVVATDRRYVTDDEVDHPAGFDPRRTLSAYATLHRYAQRVRDERIFNVPTVQWIERMPDQGGQGPVCENACTHSTCQGMAWWRSRPIRLTVHTERMLLTRQLVDWVAFQPWVHDLYVELRSLREQLKAVNGTSDPKPLEGVCPRFDEKGAACRGRLWPVAPVHSTGTFITTEEGGVNAVQCERDHEHHWEGRDLIRLSLILDQAAQESKR